jgi:hypothetical protein
MTLGLAVACSDDDKPVGQKDAALPDTNMQDDQGTNQDAATEAAAGDLTPDVPAVDLAPDMPLTPDMPASSTNWEVMNVSPGQKLYAVDGKSKTVVYAAGAQGLIMKYDGSKWATMTNPDTNKTTLVDFHINKDYVHAYGSQVRLYLSGSKWAKGYIPSYSSQYYNFVDVWGPSTSSSKIGVGDMGYYMGYKTTSTMTSSWSSIYFGSTTLTASLAGIWGSSISNVFAVGDKGEIWHCTSSCASSSKTNWTKQTAITTNNLKDVWGADSKNVFAVGLGGTILKYDGTSWKKMTINTYTYFYGVWGTSATDVWAVGHPIFKKDEAIWHYNGTAWSKVPPPGQPYLNAIWGADKDNVFVVGNTQILKLKKHP